MFDTTLELRGDLAFLRCRGDLVAGSAIRQLASLADDMNVDHIVAAICDLTNVAVVDHIGLVVLLTTSEHFRLKHRRLIFIDPQDHLSAALTHERGSQFVEVAADEAQAMVRARA